MKAIGTLPGERLAGLSADLFHKLQKGVRTLDELALFNQGKNPFGDTASAFSRNQHGHFVFTITGLYLTGAQEIERLEASGYRVGHYAGSVLRSVGEDGYDQKHLLIAGHSYQVVIMPGNVITKDRDRTTGNLRIENLMFGYKKPLAGIVPRIRELVSDKKLEEMGLWYIAGLHDPILDSNGRPCVLTASRHGYGRWVGASSGGAGGLWPGGGAFAFLVPAS